MLKLPLKILIREHVSFFQAVNIHCPPLNGVVLDYLSRPFAEPHGTLVVYLKPNSNGYLEIIVVRIVIFAVSGSY